MNFQPSLFQDFNKRIKPIGTKKMKTGIKSQPRNFMRLINPSYKKDNPCPPSDADRMRFVVLTSIFS